MAYDDDLAARIRERLARRRDIREKRLFGGVGFLLNGNLLVGVKKDSLVARIGREQGEAALREPHVRPFDVGGRTIPGWVLVGPEGVEDDDRLAEWIDRAAAFVETLPAK